MAPIIKMIVKIIKVVWSEVCETNVTFQPGSMEQGLDCTNILVKSQTLLQSQSSPMGHSSVT